jgi:hypothetical protein
VDALSYKSSLNAFLLETPKTKRPIIHFEKRRPEAVPSGEKEMMTSTALAPQFWNRDELYEDVWNQPLIALMPKYGVSAVAIGKTCRKLQVPLPGRGYWAKKAHGHSVVRKALPKLLDVPRIVRYVRPVIANTIPNVPTQPAFPVEPEDKTDIDRINQTLSTGAFVLTKPRKALRDPLIVAARDILRHSVASKQILQVPWNQSCLDIRVSKASLSRALGIMAAIISIFENHGVKVQVMPSDQSYGRRSNETVATIFGERIQFSIAERTKQERVPDPTATPDAGGRQRLMSRYEATGELSIHVSSSSNYFTTTWRDTEQTKVESLVPECIASMMKIAVEYRRGTVKRHQEEFFRKLHWEELKQLKTQIEAEEARVQRLENGADNWHRARRIREYVLALVECRRKQEKELGPHTALGRWTIWALQQADRIDPLAESPFSILDRKRELEGWSPYGWR